MTEDRGRAAVPVGKPSGLRTEFQIRKQMTENSDSHTGQLLRTSDENFQVESTGEERTLERLAERTKGRDKWPGLPGQHCCSTGTAAVPSLRTGQALREAPASLLQTQEAGE
jgi:hypothetical protein